MKKLFISVLIIAVLVACLPFVLGFEVESRYRGLIDQFEQSGYQLESHEYQRGFFTSKARSKLVLPINDPGGELTSLPFTLISHIKHGPFNPQLGWFGEIAMFDTEIEYQDKPLFPADVNAQIETRIGFSGDGVTRLQLPAQQQPLQLKDGMTLEFAGIDGELQFDAAMSKLLVTLQSDGLQLLAPGRGKLVVGKLSGKSESSRGIEDLMLGSGSFRIARIDLQDAEKQVNVNISDIEVQADTHAVDSNIDMLARYSVGEVQAANVRYGPAIIEVSLTSFPAAALARIQENMQEMQRKHLPPEQQGMALLGVMMSVLPAVLEQNPAVALKRFELGTPQGKVKMDLSLKADGMTLADVSAPQKIIAKLQGKASIRIPESIVRLLMTNNFRQQLIATMAKRDETIDAESLQQQVDSLVDAQLNAVLGQQFVERDGLDLVSVGSLKAGLLSINGKTVPLPVIED